jgi:hypothetical protein
MEVDRAVLVSACGIVLAAVGTVLTLLAISSVTRTEAGWATALLGVAALVLHCLVLGRSGAAPAADAKLAAFVGAVAVPVGVALVAYDATPSLGGLGGALQAVIGPFALLGDAVGDALSEGLFVGAVALAAAYLWTRWPRLLFGAGVQLVLAISERLTKNAGDGSWPKGIFLLAVAAAITAAVIALRAPQAQVASSLAVPAGIAALVGALLLPIADPGRLAVGSLLVAVALLGWLLALLLLAPRLGMAIVIGAGAILLAADLGDGSHLLLALLVLAAGVALAAVPQLRPDLRVR